MNKTLTIVQNIISLNIISLYHSDYIANIDKSSKILWLIIQSVCTIFLFFFSLKNTKIAQNKSYITVVDVKFKLYKAERINDFLMNSFYCFLLMKTML